MRVLFLQKKIYSYNYGDVAVDYEDDDRAITRK